jgi:cell division protein FtsI/penicillin-binding protein 2
MSEHSPMMRRVRDGATKKSVIPRKGRIRILLVLLLLIIISWLKISGVISFGKNTVSDVVKNAAVKKEKKEKKDLKKSQLQAASLPVISKHTGIGIEEIKLLMNQRQGPFTASCDTVRNGKKDLILYYSLDSSLQKLGNTLMKQYKPLYGAVVALHPGTGRVLSLISWTNDSMPSLGDNLYSRSLFPAASIFKTITAAAAIEQAGFTSETPIPHTGRNHTLYKFQLEKELAVFKDVSLEFAFANSMNPVFARIGLYSLRKNGVYEIGKRFGFNTDIPFELPVDVSSIPQTDSTFTIAELASGFNQKTTMSPMLGALMAAGIAQRGQIPVPHMIDSIFNGDSIIYRAESQPFQTAIAPSTARELTNLMQCVARYGTARKSFRYIKSSSRFDNIEYGGKTGSVDKDSVGRVDWFIGFAKHPDDKRQRIAIGVLTVHGAFWTVHSSYIAAEYFRKYLRNIQLEDENELKITASVADSARKTENN